MSGRAAFAIVNILVVAVSVAAGFGWVPMPPAVRIAAAFWSLLILPGLAVIRLAGDESASVLESACRAFLWSLLVVLAVVTVGFIPGVTLGAIGIAAGAATVALLAAGGLRARNIESSAEAGAGEKGRHREIAGFVALFAVCFILLYGTGDLGETTDSLDHVSFIGRGLESGKILPADSFYRGGDGAGFDQRKGLWHPVMALWAARARVTPDRLWSALPGFLGFLALAAFFLFAREVTGSRRWAALSLLFMLVFYGGEGAAWLAKIGFSRNIAMAILWIDLALVIMYCRTRRRHLLVEGAAAAAAGVAVHIAFAPMLAVSLAGIVFYALLAPGARKWRRPCAVALGCCAAAAAVPLAVRLHAAPPAWNLIHTHRQGMLLLSNALAVVDPNELLTRQSPVFIFALLAAPFYFLIAPRINRRGLPFALFAAPAAIVLNPLTAPALERELGYLHYRILDAAPVMPMLAVVIGELVTRLFRPLRPLRARSLAGGIAAAAAIALFAWYPLRMSRGSIDEWIAFFDRRPFRTDRPYETLIAFVERGTPPGCVVATDPSTGYVISAFTDRYIVAAPDQHCSPADTAAVRRLRDLRDLLSPAVPLDSSLAALDRMRVRYIIVNTGLGARGDFFRTFDPSVSPLTVAKLRGCAAVREVAEESGYVLFALERGEPPDVEEENCARPLAGALPCFDAGDAIGRDAGCGVTIEKIVLETDSVAVGDTIRIGLCWRASSAIEFGLPLDVTLRLDAPFPRGGWYRDWYGKPYRRWLERRTGAYYRHTLTTALRSGCAQPDQWHTREAVRQDVAIVIPPYAAEGIYDLRVSTRRVPYLPVRTLADYLRNRDSFDGISVGRVTVRRSRGEAGSGMAGAHSAGGDR